MKRILSVLLAAHIALCLSAPFSYAEQSRYTTTDDSFEGIAEYATREQAIARFVRAVGIEKFSTDSTILNKYSDKSKISYAYLDEMSAAVFSGLISGYEDKTLRPQAGITRIEALVVLGRALSRTDIPDRYSITFSDTPEWAKNYVSRLASAGIVKGYGDGTLGARDPLTLEQVETLCDRIERYNGPTGDFYNYVNSDWLNTVTLDSGAAKYSDTDKISQNLNNCIADIIFSLYRRHYNDGEEFENGSNEKKIIDVYSAAADMGHRNKTGITPILPLIGEIGAAGSIDELVTVMAKLDRLGFGTAFPVGLDTNMYNSTQYLPALSAGYTGLDAALIRTSDSKYMDYYREYIAALFEISGETAENARKFADSAAEFCVELADAAASAQDSTDITTAVKICDMNKLNTIFKNIKIEKYLTDHAFDDVKNTAVYSIPYALAADELFVREHLDKIKAYLKASVLDFSSMYMTTETFEAYLDFQNSLTGSSADLIPTDMALGIVEELLGWELGAMYIDLYFPENSRTMVEELTNKIVAEYEKLINSSTRMTPQTRSAAIRKLKSLKVNAAYPPGILTYRDELFVTRPTDDGGNLMEYKMNRAAAQNDYSAELIKTGEAAYHDGWIIYPQTVNAMYDPISNSITIPAGILQPPYFDPSAEFEENLGGIGSVIAHEISHAFDSIGAQFDHKGNLFGWWTETDYVAFEQVCSKVVAEYDEIKTPQGNIDGKLTLDENLADLAGMSCILSLAGADNPNLDKLFTAYARVWRTKTTPEYDSLMLRTDEHSPSNVRVNRVLSNFDEFVKTYGIIEGDGMYLPEENRINIWE